MTLKVIVVSLAIYAVYLPVAVWVHRDYVPIEQPKGYVVELLLGFEDSEGGGYQARTTANHPYLKAVLYEDLTPLGQVDILALPWRPPSWRFIKMPIKDGSDPRTNGRRYYLVQH